jgi:RNA polymerase sigma factor (sigma-70 family)
MTADHTTALVQRCLDELSGHSQEDSVALAVRDLLGGAAQRLHDLCSSMLHRSYPRLARPPLNVHSEEMLSAVVERLIKALREARPTNVRQFFALANQHIRWELNDLARRFDERSAPVELGLEHVSAPALGDTRASGTGSGANASRILAAIEALDDETREVFDLIRVQNLTHVEAANLLGVSTKTIQRRLNRGLLDLAAQLGDLRIERDDSQ